MSRKKEITYWACDFETSVWGEEIEKKRGKKQDETEVWSAASVKLYDRTETVTVDHSIRDFLDRFLRYKGNNVLYFHNLGFDGSFIVDFLLNEGYEFTNDKDKDMPNNTFRTCISTMGQWYFVKIRKGHTLLEIRDSLKLMPTSLDNIAKSFKTKYQKLYMEYVGDRYAYCEITDEELKYIKNDVLVLKEALEKMFDEGHNKLTIGSCCLAEFKEGYERFEYNSIFADLNYTTENHEGTVWEYVHKSYTGAWCYVNPEYGKKLLQMGRVYDVNSLYPSMMHSMSGNKYPTGEPSYFRGDQFKTVQKQKNKYYFVHVKCRFKLKEGYFPWIHIRKSPLYKANENLSTSDVKYQGQYSRYYIDIDGLIKDTVTEITFTQTDWVLFNETYDIFDLEILGGYMFRACSGIFDEYIDKFKQLKMESTGFKRELAKLFLNNLYGKMAMSHDSSYKVPYLSEENIVEYDLVEEHNKTPGYIPCGSAIISYARNFTIRAAIANRDRFAYADTDSIHIVNDLPAEGINVHPTEFCCWKWESTFDMAHYESQKRYAEHIIKDGDKEITPYLDIKCSGLTQRGKKKFLDSGRGIGEFNSALEIERANLKKRRVRGGIILSESDFKIRQPQEKKVKIYQGKLQ